MAAVHKFDDKLAEGVRAEAELDAFFRGRFGFEITPATRAEQRLGIDRHFFQPSTGGGAKVDYKTDFRAHETGNAFIETVSVDTAGKPGWAISSHADWIIYYIPALYRVYVLELATIRRWLNLWGEIFQTRVAHNQAYGTHGILVPLEELGAVAKRVFEVVP